MIDKWLKSKILNAPFGKGKAREIESRIMLPLTAFVSRVGLTADILTVIGLLMQGLVAIVLAKGYVSLGGWLLLFAVLFDMLDGQVARYVDGASARGAFLDSMCDQVGDLLVFLGLMHLQLSTEEYSQIAITFLALFGSMLNSHARSRGGMLGVRVTAGLMTRAERCPIMIIGFVLNRPTLVLWVLAILNHFSALQRFMQVWRKLSDEGINLYER